jgi:hypothetical protein
LSTKDCDFTVVVGIDRRSAEQLMVSHVTWWKLRNELWQKPWLIFWDDSPDTGLRESEIQRIAQTLDIKNARFVRWNGPYASQREKMVSGHVFVPAEHCQTDWFMKIDTDAIAVANTETWPDPAWFSGEFCMIASSWGYTKAKGGGPLGDDIRAWCDALEEFGDQAFKQPRLELSAHISSSGSKIIMRRMASWICFHHTPWVQSMAEKFSSYCGRRRLPVPSHDTSLWYAAERSKQKYHLQKMNRYGWAVRNGLKAVRRETAKVLG